LFYHMRKLIFIAVMLAVMFSCEKNSTTTSTGHTARVAGYDLNCSTCLLEFPYDSQSIIDQIGRSTDNIYQAVNLNKNDLKVGQFLEVGIRKAEPGELPACLALYPTGTYENIFVTEADNVETFNSIDTILLPYKQCMSDQNKQAYICFDSVLNDSRCPPDAICIWEGNACVRFKFGQLNEEPVLFNLNTHNMFTRDTVLGGYRFKLLNVYPQSRKLTGQTVSRAELSIESVSR
jgi:hypothetical protein